MPDGFGKAPCLERVDLDHGHFGIAELALEAAMLGAGGLEDDAMADIAQLELRLEDLEENEAERQAAPPDPALPGGQSRPRAKAVRRPLPDHLPRETVVHEPATLCDCCKPGKLAWLGEDVTEVLEKIPARLKVIRHVRPRYACRVRESVFQASAPDLPIERGRPGPGLIAHVVVSKYCDGLPLFRQSVILAREGVEINRVTLADWIGRAAWWLAPLARLIGTAVTASPPPRPASSSPVSAHPCQAEIRPIDPSICLSLLSRVAGFLMSPPDGFTLSPDCVAWVARRLRLSHLDWPLR